MDQKKPALSYLDPKYNRVCLSYLESYANDHEKNSSHISWEALHKRWGMMFIVAVLMLAFLIFVHELGHFTIAQANDSYMQKSPF
ncbi:hypothetical protein KVL50_04830 [Helicobacter pylori]|nr:hypothetical protein KVL50_04830 [Helicobacter pylori]